MIETLLTIGKIAWISVQAAEVGTLGYQARKTIRETYQRSTEKILMGEPKPLSWKETIAQGWGNTKENIKEKIKEIKGEQNVPNSR